MRNVLLKALLSIITECIFPSKETSAVLFSKIVIFVLNRENRDGSMHTSLFVTGDFSSKGGVFLKGSIKQVS